MEPIRNDKPPKNNTEQAFEKFSNASNKVKRSIVNYTSSIVGIFIVFVVIVVFTTNIKLTETMKIAELGLAFFILLFCSYSMYINYASGGIKAGRESSIYTSTTKTYNEKKEYIDKNKYQSRTPEFCRYFTKEELQNTRSSILFEVGIDFDVYMKSYIGKDKEALQKNNDLSKSQIDGILRANSMKPINLSAEMIFKRGRGNRSRHPLGTKPETKRRFNYGTKFVTTGLSALLAINIMLDVITDPSWATFAACCLKVLLVVLNGFMGYKMGYNNIVVDTVDYMNDQIDLMQRLIQYVEANPTPQNIDLTDKPADENVETEETKSENVVSEIKTEPPPQNQILIPMKQQVTEPIKTIK